MSKDQTLSPHFAALYAALSAEDFMQEAKGVKTNMTPRVKGDRVLMSFAAMSASKGALKRALKAAGYSATTGKFPAIEVEKSRNDKSQIEEKRKSVYFAKAKAAIDGMRGALILCPQDGLIELSLIPVKVERVEEVKAKKDKRPPMVQAMDRYRDKVVNRIQPGTTHKEAVEQCVADLVLELDHVPEAHRERIAKKAVRSWGPLGKLPLPVPLSERVVPPKPTAGAKMSLSAMLASFGV